MTIQGKPPENSDCCPFIGRVLCHPLISAGDRAPALYLKNLIADLGKPLQLDRIAKALDYDFKGHWLGCIVSKIDEGARSGLVFTTYRKNALV